MKIAYINSFYAPLEIGGAEKSIRFLAEAMVANGHESAVITLGRQRESETIGGVRVERLPAANLYFPADAGPMPGWKKMVWHALDSYNPLSGLNLGKVLDEIKPDVVHTNNLAGLSVATWATVRGRGIPIVHTLRDYYLLCPNTAMFKHGKPCAERCGSCKLLATPRAAATHHVHTVVGNSRFILDKHRAMGLFSQARQTVVYNAYQPTTTTSSRPSAETVLGFIGRLAPSKGLEVLIDAVKGLVGQQATLPSFRLLIAGDGDPTYVASLRSRATGLPISFMGRMVPEVFYNQVHWTVVPSLWDEPLARVLFESFAHGIPVIGAATGGTPELIEEGVTGHLYAPAENPPSLTKLLAQVLTQTGGYVKLAQTCLERSTAFKPEHVYQQYLDLYLNAIAERVRP